MITWNERESDVFDTAFKWINAVEQGKSRYYVDDVQTTGNGYTFKITHGDQSMSFFVYEEGFSVYVHELKYGCCCTTRVLFDCELSRDTQEKIWNFAVNLYEHKMSNNPNEEMEWNITVMLWGCFVAVLLGAVGIMYILWKG